MPLTALCVIGVIILLIAALMMTRGELVICYGEDLELTVRVLKIPIKILPKKEKKIRLSDYSPKKRARIEKKRRLADAKRAKKDAEKKKKKEEAAKAEKEARAKGKSTKRPIGETISMIGDLVRTAVTRFAKHLRVRIARLHISVASSDAASTAILYGVISQSVAYIAALLDSTNTLRYPTRSDVDIHADYLSEKTTLDIEIGFSLRVWQIFDILFRTGFAFMRHI